MSQVSAVNGNPKTRWEKVQAAGTKEEGTAVNLNELSSGRIVKDRVEFSEEWSGMDLKDIVKKALDCLKEQYPSIDIVIDEKESVGELPGLAAGLGRGTHLVISQKFLERMGSSTEEFGKCSSVLTGIAKQLACQEGSSMASGAYVGQSGAAFWTAGNRPETGEGRLAGFSGFSDTSADKNNILTNQLSKTAAVSVSRHYSRLAGARTKGQVQTVMADVQRSIGNLQMTAVYGDDEEKVKASRALRSLKKLLARGNRKISRLNKEQLAALKKKRAEKEQEEKKAEQARQEMKRIRAGKTGSDHSLVMEGSAVEAYIRGYRHYRKLKEEYEGSRISGTDMLSAGISTEGAVESAGAAGGEIAAADVTVSGTISF
ncbi:hypothetical protein [Clostridium sp. Marseille-P2415]|uniref:hypothetical protein n=1 Tax=Clostridium sp. Marseille-P2415 TaxID=1805471 RepID=UPI0009884668|nr:hypothetical protein [Clostridium sp. Marseille-P2415]